MDNIDNLLKLLECGVITKEEYLVLLDRITKANGEYNYTWKDTIDEYYSWCIDNYSLTTAKGYKTCLYKFIMYLTKKDTNKQALNVKFSEFNFSVVNNFLRKMEEDNFSAQTISKTRYAIIVLCKFLANKGIEVPDVSKIKISINKEVNNTTIALRSDEIINIANSTDLRSKVCILLAYECALRRVELSRLKTTNFNFEKNQLYIYSDKEEIDRVCILTKETNDLVKNYIEQLYYNINEWNDSRCLRGKEPRDDYGYIFQSIKMVKPSYGMLHSMLKNSATNYYKANGVSNIRECVGKITFENIRNSRKVYLLSEGYSVNDVMQLCGDKNYMSTYRFNKLVPILYPEKVRIK